MIRFPAFYFDVAAVALLVLLAVFTSRTASRRGRSRLTWFLLSLLFGPIALLVLVLLPDLRPAAAAAPVP
jgi:hypothetical protein